MNEVKDWLESINLEAIEYNIYRGQSHDVGSSMVFGGQVLSQSLHAAMLTVPQDRIVHSMHGYFILPGDKSKPIIYDVDRIRDGGSFTTRRVVAIQNGKAIFNMAASFQNAESGLDHQLRMPDVEAPENLQTDQDLLKQFADQLPDGFKRFIRPRPIEFRPVNPMSFVLPQKQEPFRYVWFRAVGELPEKENKVGLQERLLAYASDYNLLTTAIQPHQHEVHFFNLQMASLDHAIWFHRSFRMDEWLLYAIDSPSASNSRGFTRGNIFNQSGKLVASVVQEGLMRRKK